MNKYLKVLESIVELIMDCPIRTAFIIFLTTLFIALSSSIGGVWQVAFTGLYIFLLSLICFDE